MQTVTNKRPAERLNAHELLRDYMNKINAACPLALVHHEQDAQGATLVVHVPSGNVAEAAALAKLGERLTKLVSSFPAEPDKEPENTETTQAQAEEIDESQKAVVVSPLAKARKSRKNAKADEQASDESSPSGT